MRYFLFLGILPLFGTALAAAVPAVTSSTPTGASLIPRAGSSTSSPLPTCQPYATPGKYGHVPPSACNALYEYNPTLGAPAAVAVIFGLIFIAHVVQGVVYRTLFACVVAMGASWECGGYIAMAYGSRNQQDENVLTAYTVLTYLAPLCMILSLFSMSASLPDSCQGSMLLPTWSLADSSISTTHAARSLGSSPKTLPPSLSSSTLPPFSSNWSEPSC